MRGSLGPLLAWACLGAALAGCVADSARYLEGPFAVAAPEWHAGHTWTFRDSLDVETVEDAGGGRAERQRSDVTEFVRVEVFNTTRRIDGAPAYFAWIDRASDDAAAKSLGAAAASSREVAAFRQSDLAPVASGRFEREAPSFELDNPDPGASWLEPEDGVPPLPQLRFPLAEGGAWTPANPFELPLDLAARVVGRQRVDVGSGPEALVHVRVLGLVPPAAQRGLLAGLRGPGLHVEDGALRATFVGDYLWSETAKAVVRAQERLERAYNATTTGPDGARSTHAGSYRMVHERILVDARLDRVFETPVPPYELSGIPDADLARVRKLAAAHDADLPADVGGGPVHVRFTLRAVGPGGGCVDADGLPCSHPGSGFNASRFSVAWRLTHLTDSREAARGEGESFEADLDLPGLWRARAEVYDHDYDTVVRVAETTLETRWSTRLANNAPPGLPQRISVGLFFVQFPGAFLDADFRLEAAQAGLPTVDHGRFILVSPSGNAQSFLGQGTLLSGWPTERGLHRVEWQPEGTVVAGDDPVVRVEVRYPSPPPRVVVAWD